MAITLFFPTVQIPHEKKLDNSILSIGILNRKFVSFFMHRIVFAFLGAFPVGEQPSVIQTRPDTRPPKSRAGGQGPYLKSKIYKIFDGTPVLCLSDGHPLIAGAL